MYDPDPNAGKLIVTVNGIMNFKYEVIYQPQGGRGIVDANGNFSYENWVSPNVRVCGLMETMRVAVDDSDVFEEQPIRFLPSK